MKLLVLLLTTAQASIGIGELAPLVTKDGEHRFRFVYKAPTQLLKKSGTTVDEWVESELQRLLAERLWCLDGWQIDAKFDTAGFTTIEGSCR